MREDHKQILENIKEFKKEFFKDKKNSRIFVAKIYEFDSMVLEMSRLIENFMRESFRLEEDDCGGNKIMADILKTKREEIQLKMKRFINYHNITLGKKEMGKELDLDKAKSVPIPEIMGVDYKRNSNRVQMFCCPIHNEKTPSFAWYSKNNRWHCFGACGKGGDSVDLYMELNNCDFITAVKELNKY